MAQLCHNVLIQRRVASRIAGTADSESTPITPDQTERKTMSFGVSNLDAVKAWKAGEPMNNDGWRSEKYCVQTDGTDLRMYRNVVATRHENGSVTWTMCGYETVSTAAVLGAAVGVRAWRQRVGQSSVPVQHMRQRIGDAAQLRAALPVCCDGTYLRRDPEILSWRSKFAKPVPHYDNTHSNPLRGAPMGVNTGSDRRYGRGEYVQAFRRNAAGGVEQFVPTDDQMTDDAVVCLGRSRIAYDKVLTPAGLVTLQEAQSGGMVFSRLVQSFAVRRLPSGGWSVRLQVRAAQMKTSARWLAFKHVLADTPVVRGAYNSIGADLESLDVLPARTEQVRTLLLASAAGAV